VGIQELLVLDSLATLVDAFVTSRVDYCVSLLAGAPKKTRDKLQHVLSAAAQVIAWQI